MPTSLFSMGAYDDDESMPRAPDFPNNPNNPNDPDFPCDAIGVCPDGTIYSGCATYFDDPCRGHYVDPKPDPTCGNYTDEFISKQSELWKCINCDNNTYAECTANQVPKQERDPARGYVSQSGYRQFTVTLSNDEVANLCNCPTESAPRAG